MIKTRIKSACQKLRRRVDQERETALLLLGKQMAWQVAALPPNSDFRQVGFKVFSQWDEDGIIQYLISHVPIENQTFIEFGVENYEESNTRFLLLNNHWQGMVLDASARDIEYIRRDRIHWQYDLQVKEAWITRENIDSLIAQAGFGEDLGLLSIDLNGNDYWIWEAIERARPRIAIVEYNSLLSLAPIAVPYQDDFDRTAAHSSNLYYGSSLAALDRLGRSKGYILVGSNIWGHNAFFVRSDVAGELRGLEPEQAYVASKFREARDEAGKLTYARGEDRFRLIEHLPVINVATGEHGRLRDLAGHRDSTPAAVRIVAGVDA
ncbi:MAG: hypothetical protein WBQ85_10925 [Candidatus Sulfotelmatobacter sp.]